MKTIEAVIKDETVFICTEMIQGQIWFHFKGSIFVIPHIGQITDKPDSLTLKKNSSVFKIKHSGINEKKILAPMPGQIVKILTVTGQKVLKNQTLLILSAMKMEYTLKAPYHGEVSGVKVKEGDKVTVDQELITIKEDECQPHTL